MSKHRIVDGRLLQMNKRYGQLNTCRKELTCKTRDLIDLQMLRK